MTIVPAMASSSEAYGRGCLTSAREPEVAVGVDTPASHVTVRRSTKEIIDRRLLLGSMVMASFQKTQERADSIKVPSTLKCSSDVGGH
jgi:hypothetical protein